MEETFGSHDVVVQVVKARIVCKHKPKARPEVNLDDDIIRY